MYLDRACVLIVEFLSLHEIPREGRRDLVPKLARTNKTFYRAVAHVHGKDGKADITLVYLWKPTRRRCPDDSDLSEESDIPENRPNSRIQWRRTSSRGPR